MQFGGTQHVYTNGSEEDDDDATAEELDGRRHPELIAKYVKNSDLIDEFLNLVEKNVDDCVRAVSQMDKYLVKHQREGCYKRIPFNLLQQAIGKKINTTPQNYGKICKTQNIIK